MRSLVTFFGVVYVVSWSLFAAGAAIAARAGPSSSGLLFVSDAVTLLGVITPSKFQRVPISDSFRLPP